MLTEAEKFINAAGRPLPPQHYLASPYTSESPAKQELYVQAAQSAAASLRRKGYCVYSPLAAGTGDEAPWGWYHYDLAHLRDCKGGLLILALPGWTESLGIKLELAAAMALERPVATIDPELWVDSAIMDQIRRHD